MKFKTLAVAVAVSAPLILTGSASADFVGITTVSKDITGFEDFVARVVNLYAIFSDDDGDGIGDGLITVCAGIPGQPIDINVRDGVFYQNKFGGDRAPSQPLVNVHPELAVDTFVTVGLKVVHIRGRCDRGDATLLAPNWPGFDPDRLFTENSAWFVTPGDLQGHPGNFDNRLNAVLIGQFSVAAGAGPNASVFGTLVVSGEHGDGSAFQEFLSFDSQCQMDADCDDGDPCNGQEACVDGECPAVAPSPDCNGNGVLDSCDIAIGTSEDCNGNGIPDECDVASGTSQDINGNGVPDECECLPDLDGSGNVGVKDLLILLGAWGPCPK